MPRYLILAQSQPTANALRAWLDLLGEADRSNCILSDGPPGSVGIVEAFETLVERVEQAASGGERLPLNQVIVLVDSIRPAGLSAVEEAGSWDNLIAMLILSFPEIRWVFGVMRGEGADSCWSRTIAPQHDLASLLGPARRDPLFDPTGLRQWVRAHTKVGLQKATEGDDLELPMRHKTAAAIDEEHPCAYIHGYTAYRFGCRADVIATWSLMKARFNRREEDTAEQEPADCHGFWHPLDSHGYWLLLEDMSLKFPDKPGTCRLLDLEDRKAECSLLDSTDAARETSDHRILVTTGQTHPGDKTLRENRRYLRQKKTHGRGDVVFKPLCGMFDLWAKARLYRKQAGTARRGDAPGFVWPPPYPSRQRRSDDGTTPRQDSRHGTPGKLMLIAETLIGRARALLDRVETVGDAVQGAVLATDAMELTGGRAPTTAIEALSLKHRFEVLAECQFSGVENHLSIAPRLEEIEGETTAICRWFARRQRRSATLNARMHIFNQLVATLREQNQFDEEQTCMNRVRHIHATLWMRARPWRYLFWLPIRYVQLLLTSLPTFALVLTAWVIVLAVLFATVDPGTPPWDWASLGRGLERDRSLGHPSCNLVPELPTRCRGLRGCHTARTLYVGW